jgi:hypothetical protein
VRFTDFVLQAKGLPFHDDFASGDESGWVAYDGNWNVRDGVMVNESNERGAKMTTGSPYWTNYALDSDISLNSTGDAGVIARVSDAELGVDAYSGLYGSLRVRDQALVFGGADHGWKELVVHRMPSPILSNVWYHLRLELRGCDVSLSSRQTGLNDTAWLDISVQQCPGHGEIGLRSYDSGGQWKNVRVAIRGGAKLDLAVNVADRG